MPVPRQSDVEIAVTLSNDSDHPIDVDDLALKSDGLFRISVEDSARQEVFSHEERRPSAGWKSSEVKEFTTRWNLVGARASASTGLYTVRVKFGFGGGLTARTRLR